MSVMHACEKVHFSFAAKEPFWARLCLSVDRNQRVRAVQREIREGNWCVAQDEDGNVGLLPLSILRRCPGEVFKLVSVPTAATPLQSEGVTVRSGANPKQSSHVTVTHFDPFASTVCLEAEEEEKEEEQQDTLRPVACKSKRHMRSASLVSGSTITKEIEEGEEDKRAAGRDMAAVTTTTAITASQKTPTRMDDVTISAMSSSPSAPDDGDSDCSSAASSQRSFMVEDVGEDMYTAEEEAHLGLRHCHGLAKKKVPPQGGSSGDKKRGGLSFIAGKLKRISGKESKNPSDTTVSGERQQPHKSKDDSYHQHQEHREKEDQIDRQQLKQLGVDIAAIKTECALIAGTLLPRVADAHRKVQGEAVAHKELACTRSKEAAENARVEAAAAEMWSSRTQVATELLWHLENLLDRAGQPSQQQRKNIVGEDRRTDAQDDFNTNAEETDGDAVVHCMPVEREDEAIRNDCKGLLSSNNNNDNKNASSTDCSSARSSNRDSGGAAAEELKQLIQSERETLLSYQAQRERMDTRSLKVQSLLAQLDAESTSLKISETTLEKIAQRNRDYTLLPADTVKMRDGFEWPRVLDGLTEEEETALLNYVRLFDKYNEKRERIDTVASTSSEKKRTVCLSVEHIAKLRKQLAHGDEQVGMMEDEVVKGKEFIRKYSPVAAQLANQLEIGTNVLSQKKAQFELLKKECPM